MTEHLNQAAEGPDVQSIPGRREPHSSAGLPGPDKGGIIFEVTGIISTGELQGGMWLARSSSPETVDGGASGEEGGVLLERLAAAGPLLAVVAHPDDESFGLGAVLAALGAVGGEVRVLCFTHGEASTLGAREDLGRLREEGLQAAAVRLGLVGVSLYDFPDGGLATLEDKELDDVLEDHVAGVASLVAFEPLGVTGHPDHVAATSAAWRAARRHGLAVLEWGVAPSVAEQLNAELGTAFSPLEGPGSVELTVDRAVQRQAISCHASQAGDNVVLQRRLALSVDRERVRLREPAEPRRS